MKKQQETAQGFATRKDVLAYLTGECGRKISQSKLYADIKSGLLRAGRGGTFTRRAVDAYAASLAPVSGVTAKNQDKAEALALRRQEAALNKDEENARILRRRREILEGKYLERGFVMQQLAARAVAFRQGLVAMMEAETAEVVELVNGDQAKAAALPLWFEERLGLFLSDYCAVEAFSVQVGGADMHALNALAPENMGMEDETDHD